MPMWCPPTPPSSEGDVYCDSWARALYRPGAAADALLPPVRWRERAPRSPRRSRPAARAPAAPPSLFERSGPRARTRRPAPAPQHATPPPDWAPHEDAALRRALRLQRLPPEPPAAHAPNWDWLADLVADAARAYRSPRACRDRHDALADPDRARRKHRPKPLPRRRPDDETPRPPLQRIDAMRDAAERRRAAPKRRLDDASHHNPKHAALLADHGVDYDAPPTPMEVATRRAERIAKEKLKAGASAAAGVPASSAPAAVSGAGPGTPAPQRIVVAAGGGAGAGETRRPRPDAPLLYRQQALAARHHLKILHHPSPPQSGASVASIDGGGAGGAGGALRSLQLQQLALRRARPPHHVVLAHLAPAPSAAPASSAPPAPTAPAPPQHAPDPPQ